MNMWKSSSAHILSAIIRDGRMS